MSDRNTELFLFDVYIAILKIEEVANRFERAEDLKHDFMAWDTIIREFEIIGEATNRLIKNGLLDEKSRVVVDFRNLLIHHYFGIDAEEVFDVIKNDLLDYKNIIIQKIENIENTLKREILEEVYEENRHLPFVVNKLNELIRENKE